MAALRDGKGTLGTQFATVTSWKGTSEGILSVANDSIRDSGTRLKTFAGVESGPDAEVTAIDVISPCEDV